jgi:argonaute-like protein implicated in RNA metabolism and viral defense
LDCRPQSNKTNFSQNIKDIFHKIGFDIGFKISKTTIQNFFRVELEKAVRDAQTKNPHLLLCILPDRLGNQEEPYELLKSITINNDLPSQCIYESTLKNQYALGNMVLGILGKTGNIPFVLADPLPFTDFIVGLDVAREKKKDLPGSINTTAIARIYCNDGDLVKYTINDTAIEGETIPDKVLEALFPYHHFAGKHVVIHRDGLFRGNEKAALQQRAVQLGATFYLVEIIKNDAPRLYCQSEKHKSDENPHGIIQPAKGTIFKISETEAFLVSSLPPFQNSTPQPLHLRSDTSLGIDKAIKSVLALTLLHYGSLRPPRLPVSIHYSDKIGYLALRGIRPNNSQGQIPFWL